jgi:hypothetical protein
MVPLPLLLVLNPAENGDISCVYLGMASAWLTMEIFRLQGGAMTRAMWRGKFFAATIAVLMDLGLFVLLAWTGEIRTNIPMAFKAFLSILPALGMSPFLLSRIGKPYGALILGALLVLAAKLTGCVVARIVYGPDYIAQGYVAENWNTAKLMITIFWSLTLFLSAVFLLWDYSSLPTAAIQSAETA